MMEWLLEKLKQWLMVPGGSCAVCGRILFKIQPPICSNCLRRLPVIREKTCAACGRPIFSEESHFCSACAGLSVEERCDGGLVYLHYRDDGRDLIAGLKFNTKLVIGQWLGEQLAGRVPVSWQADAIVPVPLHSVREEERGYNQSFLIAEGMAAVLGISVKEDWLVRTRNTPHQTGLNRKARQQNMKEAFQASPQVFGKRIILVDDVMTTGSTLKACAKALRDTGAASVYIACAAARA